MTRDRAHALVIVAGVPCHGGEPKEWIIWDGDAVQREAWGPIIPCEPVDWLKSVKTSALISTHSLCNGF